MTHWAQMTGDSENSLYSVCFKPVHLLPVASLLLSLCLCVCLRVCVLSLSLSFKSLSSLNLLIYFNFFVSYPFFSSFSFRSRLASHSPFAQPLLSFVSFTLSQSHILFLPTFLSTFLFLFSISFSQFFHWFSFLFLSVIFLPHSLYPHFTLRSL